VEQNGALLVSPSVEALVRHPGVSTEINRVALADHLRHRWPVLEETYYEAVRRLPGGYLLNYRNGANEVGRYWRPNRDLDHSLTPEETQARFDELLQQGVARCMFAPSAIFLSGGLDSVSVAAFAAENAAKNGWPRPYALSLVFEDDVNEEDTQVAVARQLGFEQTIVPLLETVPRKGLLRAAMEMSAAQPAPMLNFWSPAYRYLAIEGRRRGRAVILTGNGGDEWLEYPIVNGERMIKKGDLVGMYRAWRTLIRSRRISRRGLAKNIAWTYGASLILRETGSKTLQTVAPGALRARRRRRIASETGDWLVDDPALLAQILERYEAAAPRLRESLDSPHTARDFEESFERARMLGLRTAHPLWDVDLTAFLERLPPESLIYGGRSKALVRYSLARRFPDLGFETQRKAAATSVFKSCMFEQAPDAWRELGGVKALAELGVVDKARTERRIEQLLGDGETWHNYWVWYVLTIEAWLRPRVC
jgi:asparagine synthetase B (glutamine-hydrolysing)